MMSVDLSSSQPVVIDSGSFAIKGGFAGEEAPSVVLESVIGRPKHLRVMPGGALEGSNT
jgi:centractin